MNAIVARDLDIAATITKYGQSVLLRQLGKLISFPKVVGSMGEFVGDVLRVCRPPQMPIVDAELYAAGMGDFMRRRRRWTVDGFANKAVSPTMVAVLDLGIPIGASGKRPNNTFVGLSAKGAFVKPHRRPIWRSSRQRVTVSLPSPVVRIAHSESASILVAAINRAYRFCSHLDLSSGWALVRARRRPASLRRVRMFYLRGAGTSSEHSVGLRVGLLVPLYITSHRLFRSCVSRRTHLRAANPSVAWPRSVAQPGSAPDLGTVVPASKSDAFPNTSQHDALWPWEFLWDFLWDFLQRSQFPAFRDERYLGEMR